MTARGRTRKASWRRSCSPSTWRKSSRRPASPSIASIPQPMDTTMVREGGISPISTVDEGAAAILNLVLSPDLGGRTGLYFDRQRLSRANPQAYDEAARQRLHNLTLQLVGPLT